MKFAIDYMVGAAENPVTQALKSRSYELMNLKAGDAALDIGCGPGIDTVALAAQVGEEGRVFGIDIDPDMVAAANDRAVKAGVDARVEHTVGDCLALPFNAGEFDSCRCERLLQHIPAPESAGVVAEALRVIRPGGALVFLDTDWPSLSIHSKYPRLERYLTQRLTNHWANGFAARSMPELISSRDVTDVRWETIASPVPPHLFFDVLGDGARRAIQQGDIPADRWREWSAAVAEQLEDGSFYGTLNLVICWASKK